MASGPNQANAEWNKEARRALTHFREFTEGLFATPQLPGDTEQERPLHGPASLGRYITAEERDKSAVD